MLSFVVSRVCGLCVSTVYLHCNMHPQFVELGCLLHLTEPPFVHCFLCILCQLHLLQDTIIGLKALAAFARRTFTPEMNMTVYVEADLQSDIIEIRNKNRYTRHEVMVRSVCLIPTRLLYITHSPTVSRTQSGVQHPWCGCRVLDWKGGCLGPG